MKLTHEKLLTEGVHEAVLIDVIDLGEQEDEEGMCRPMVEFVFSTRDQQIATIRCPKQWGQWEGLTYVDNTNQLLRQLGVKIVDGMLDLESLVGKQVQVMIQLQPDSPESDALVPEIVHIGKPVDHGVVGPADYVRVRDRAKLEQELKAARKTARMAVQESR